MSFKIIEGCVGINSVGRTLGSFLLPSLCYGLNRNIWFTHVLQNLWHAFESHSFHYVSSKVRWQGTYDSGEDRFTETSTKIKAHKSNPSYEDIFMILGDQSNYLGTRRRSSLPFRLLNTCHSLRAFQTTKIPFLLPFKLNAMYCNTSPLKIASTQRFVELVCAQGRATHRKEA